ncbi:hypothetical protein B0H66DRAFT_622923 [Apodospora peruviana]|uniref:Uncharacterized protein n=1 Tax=Apodospora peruviana TaxID=516989 RepID=A0AAE0I614_9PEZI|nr:hypothetical protein B0H66DRAFT_622923 [Apodospora peruviana]
MSATTTEYTTSTIYAISTYTVTSYPLTVTNYPYGSVTTKTIATSTTICLVTYTPTTISSVPEDWTTSTVYATTTYTITSYAPAITTYRYGSVTTEVVPVTTTVCPIGSLTGFQPGAIGSGDYGAAEPAPEYTSAAPVTPPVDATPVPASYAVGNGTTVSKLSGYAAGLGQQGIVSPLRCLPIRGMSRSVEVPA